MATKRCGENRRTVFPTEDEPVEPVQAEEVEEVPGERGHPADVHVRCLDPALEHALEAERERKWELDWTPRRTESYVRAAWVHMGRSVTVSVRSNDTDRKARTELSRAHQMMHGRRKTEEARGKKREKERECA